MKDDFVVLSAESGKGKSTILKAIMKEVEDSNISITINNKNISDINYNSKILYVTQDSYMFYDSIINNISLGEKYTQDLLDEVIDCCCLRKFINQY